MLFRSPYTKDASIHRITETSWSMPSGHAQASAVFFPLLAGIQRRWKLWVRLVVAIVFPLLVGLSRIYLGVHYPTDVLVGWVLGFIVSLAFLFLSKSAFELASKIPMSYKILLVAIVAVIFNWLCSDTIELPALIFGFGAGYT